MGFWDRAFDIPGYKYGEEPNAYLVAVEPRFSRGARVLLPGDGEGRNGTWLAGRGHRVTTVDGSRVGIRKARALAAARGVTLDIREADLNEWVPPVSSLDATVSIYLHLPEALRRRVHRGLAAALLPGGWFVLEAFHPGQLDGYRSGGPKDVAMLYTVDILREDLSDLGLREVEAFSGEVALHEGAGHEGPAMVTRYLAQRS